MLRAFLSSLLAGVVIDVGRKVFQHYFGAKSFEYTAESFHDIAYIAVLLFILFLTIKHIRSGYLKSRLLSESGLDFVRIRKTDQDTDFIQEHLVSNVAGETTVKILGASGFKTFGSRDSFLYKIMELDTTSAIQVMLLDPKKNNPGLIQRANSLDVLVDDYIKEIESSIETLRTLKQKGKTVSLLLYTRSPCWKLYIASNHVWVQKYPAGKHVSESEMLGFKNTHNHRSPYNHFVELFDAFSARIADKKGVFIFDTTDTNPPPAK